MTTRRIAPIALSAIALGVVASACGIHIGITDYAKSMPADAQVSGPVTEVNVQSDSGTIKIHSGAGSGVTINRTVHYSSGHPHPSQSVQNGVLTFTKSCNNCSIDYDLTVPASVKVTARADSGDVKVRGVASADINTSSGTLTATDIKGDVTAQNDSGDVNLTSVGGTLDLSTSSGTINGSALGGTIAQAKDDSGGIKLAFTTVPMSVTAHSASGDVRVKVPQYSPTAPSTRVSYVVNTKTASGSPTVNVSQIRPGSASDPHLDLSTDSGDVHVDPTT